MINYRINHLLEFTRIGVKGNLSRQWQILLLDDFSTPIQAERFQTKLPVILHSLFYSLLLILFEICFCHADNVVCVELRAEHIDHVEDVPPGMPKDVLMQKWICKHKGLIPDIDVKACQSI